MTDSLPRLGAGLDALVGPLDANRVRARISHQISETDRAGRISSVLAPATTKPNRWRRTALVAAITVVATVTGIVTYQAVSHIGGQNGPAPIANTTAPTASSTPSPTPTPTRPLMTSAVHTKIADLDLIYQWKDSEIEDSGASTVDGIKRCFTPGDRMVQCRSTDPDGTTHYTLYSDLLKIWTEYDLAPGKEILIGPTELQQFETLIDMVRRDDRSRATIVNETLEGKPAIHITVPDPDPIDPSEYADATKSYGVNPTIIDLWIAADTYLPLKSVTMSAGFPEPKSTYSYTWLPRTPENEAVVDPPIPDGYEEVNQRQWDRRFDEWMRDELP